MIAHEGRTEYLGSFAEEDAAARAYDTAARRLRGDQAHGHRERWRLNFPTEAGAARYEYVSGDEPPAGNAATAVEVDHTSTAERYVRAAQPVSYVRSKPRLNDASKGPSQHDSSNTADAQVQVASDHTLTLQAAAVDASARTGLVRSLL